MTFVMGLDDSFSQIMSQLLLLVPIPPINKVFSLISQEERQKSIASQTSSGGTDTVNNMAFLVKNVDDKKSGATISTGNRYSKRYRPFYTRCNFHRHTIKKCYKIHGYSPGYKQDKSLQSI